MLFIFNCAFLTLSALFASVNHIISQHLQNFHVFLFLLLFLRFLRLLLQKFIHIIVMNFFLRLRLNFKKIFLVAWSLTLDYTLIVHEFWGIVGCPCLIWKKSLSFVTFINNFWFLRIERDIILLNNRFILLRNSIISKSSGVNRGAYSLSRI